MGKQPSNTTTTTKFEMSPEQRALIAGTVPIAQNYLKNPPKLPGYSQIAGFNANELAGQQGILDQLPGLQTQAGNLAHANNFLLSGEALNPNSNPALQGYIDAATRPITQNLMETVLPGVRGSAVTSGQYGSSRQGIAEGLASGRASQAIGDTSSTIANQGYMSGLDAMTKAMGLAPSTMQAMLMPSLAQSGVGDIQRNMSQALLSEKAYKDMYAQMAPFLAAQEVAAMAAGYPGGSATATQSGGGQSGLSSLFSGALGGASLGTSIFGPGWGTLGGGGIGALMSLFG